MTSDQDVRDLRLAMHELCNVVESAITASVQYAPNTRGALLKAIDNVRALASEDDLDGTDDEDEAQAEEITGLVRERDQRYWIDAPGGDGYSVAGIAEVYAAFERGEVVNATDRERNVLMIYRSRWFDASTAPHEAAS